MLNIEILAILEVSNVPKLKFWPPRISKKGPKTNLMLLRRRCMFFKSFSCMMHFSLSLKYVSGNRFYSSPSYISSNDLAELYHEAVSQNSFLPKDGVKNIFKKAMYHEKRNSHDTCCLILGGPLKT